jgi:Methionine synthase I, cobalamin-binding domain
METFLNEVYRYMGYGRNVPEGIILELTKDVINEVEYIAEKKSLFKVADITIAEDNIIDFGFCKVKSVNLSNNLNNCDKVIVFAATLGAGIDRLIRKYTVSDISRAVVVQAVAAAYIEDYCNQLNREFKEVYNNKGYFLRPRFSPGYGDFDLSYQKDIMRFLDSAKKIGLTLTESMLMMPEKSVSAVIGIGIK